MKDALSSFQALQNLNDFCIIVFVETRIPDEQFKTLTVSSNSKSVTWYID